LESLMERLQWWSYPWMDWSILWSKSTVPKPRLCVNDRWPQAQHNPQVLKPVAVGTYLRGASKLPFPNKEVYTQRVLCAGVGAINL
jgi:hypothetical protein